MTQETTPASAAITWVDDARPYYLGFVVESAGPPWEAFQTPDGKWRLTDPRGAKTFHNDLEAAKDFAGNRETTHPSDFRLDELEKLVNALDGLTENLTREETRARAEPLAVAYANGVGFANVAIRNVIASLREATPALIGMVRHLTPYVEAFRREESRADDLALKVDEAEVRATAAEARVAEAYEQAARIADAMQAKIDARLKKLEKPNADLAGAAAVGAADAAQKIAAQIRALGRAGT
jgi:hypothetical protein